MATVTQLITAEDFMTMDLGQGTFELLQGEVVEMPPPGPEHGLICGNGAFLLGRYGRVSGIGYVLSNDSAVLTERDPDTVRGADLSFYAQARWPRAQVGSGLIPVPPIFVIEVYSPSNRTGEMLEKISEYLKAGVALVWLIYPSQRRVVAYRNDDAPAVYNESDAIEHVPELPGFRCVVADFFA